MKKIKLLSLMLLSGLTFLAAQNDSKLQASNKKVMHQSAVNSTDQINQDNSQDSETIIGDTWSAKRFGDTYVLSINFNEKIIASIEDFVKTQNIGSGEITGIGAANQVELAIYSFEKEDYITKTFNEQMEISSALGNISYKGDELFVHIHVTMGNINFEAYTGHLNEGRIHGAAEFYIRTNPMKLYKTEDETTVWSYEFDEDKL